MNRKTKEILIYALVAASSLLIVGRNAKADFTFGTPTNLGPTVNSSSDDGSHCMSADGLEFYFDSGRSGWDLWVTRRATTNDDWDPAVNLGPPINTTLTEYVPCTSPDGKQLYFVIVDGSGGYGGYDICQASIEPIVDLNSDGIVDAADMCIMVDYWGENYPLCDIGPMPWGDGIVDVQDLIVLAEHLFEETQPTEPVE